MMCHLGLLLFFVLAAWGCEPMEPLSTNDYPEDNPWSPANATKDLDGDGVTNREDNCPDVPNAAQVKCYGKCVDLTTHANCGACGNACARGASCMAGKCVCPDNTMDCEGVCTDSTTEENCGACGNLCTAEGSSCRDGVCMCPTEHEADCDGTCTDITTTENCGACGNACAEGASCTAGECACPENELACDGICTDITTMEHCGACGQACDASHGICDAGECSCDDGFELGPADSRCAPPEMADGPAGIEWLGVVGGTFAMGSNNGDPREQPVHEVTVPTFYLARTEVTVAQYRACVDAGACTTPGTSSDCNWDEAGRDEHPVNCVDWDQAQAFASWAGGRLPTEAEWEYAARSGGRDQTYPWGDAAPTCDLAIMSDGGSGCGQTHTWPVCSKPAGNSVQGACDLAGNVLEWTEDWYGDYIDTPRDGSAYQDPAGSFRVFRGGGWLASAQYLRAASRVRYGPGYRFNLLGFRPARSVP